VPCSLGSGSHKAVSRDKVPTCLACDGWQSVYIASILQEVPPVYDLFAISQHYGSLGGGHYTAAAQYEGQGWYSFNDTSVTPLETMDPADSARSAYVLFYRRQQDWRSSPSAGPLTDFLI
jgi:hypothetical protein